MINFQREVGKNDFEVKYVDSKGNKKYYYVSNEVYVIKYQQNDVNKDNHDNRIVRLIALIGSPTLLGKHHAKDWSVVAPAYLKKLGQNDIWGVPNDSLMLIHPLKYTIYGKYIGVKNG